MWAAGLFVGYLSHLRHMDLGFQRKGVLLGTGVLVRIIASGREHERFILPVQLDLPSMAFTAGIAPVSPALPDCRSADAVLRPPAQRLKNQHVQRPLEHLDPILVAFPLGHSCRHSTSTAGRPSTCLRRSGQGCHRYPDRVPVLIVRRRGQNAAFEVLHEFAWESCHGAVFTQPYVPPIRFRNSLI